MKKIGLIAGREFTAAVTNKGFVIGLLVLPVMLAMVAITIPRLARGRTAVLHGQIAVVDPTGLVLAELRSAMRPEAFARRRVENTNRALSAAPLAVREAAASRGETIDTSGAPPPDLRMVERPASADVPREKVWLTENDAAARHMALVVIHPDAVAPASGDVRYGAYDLYVANNLEDRVEDLVFDSVREALIAARIRAHHLDHAEVDALMRVARAQSVTVTKENERQTDRNFNRVLPFAFAFLLLISIVIGGQTLLTQTVEEKSSRVIEVLLSAVSPIELMAGKILGQMAVSLLVLSVYIAMALMLLTSFAMLGLVDPLLLLYLLLFFFIEYLVFAAVFGAVGASVNEMREAQSLMTPVMLVLMAPWLFASAIAADPNSTFSVALSLTPPINTFAMMIRLASNTPPPFWQVGLSIVIGVASAYVAIWFAAKIFKVGLLMTGKAPDFSTLIRWAREA